MFLSRPRGLIAWRHVSLINKRVYIGTSKGLRGNALSDGLQKYILFHFLGAFF